MGSSRDTGNRGNKTGEQVFLFSSPPEPISKLALLLTACATSLCVKESTLSNLWCASHLGSPLQSPGSSYRKRGCIRGPDRTDLETVKTTCSGNMPDGTLTQPRACNRRVCQREKHHVFSRFRGPWRPTQANLKQSACFKEPGLHFKL